MAESWFSLSRGDQAEALEFAAARTRRPAHLLEKDIWLVWVLSAIYESDLARKLTFKGGTSLSKVYRIIDRFSEDVDLTYDIRELASDLLKEGNPIPYSSSQQRKISSAIRHRLPDWIEETVSPVITAALENFYSFSELLELLASLEPPWCLAFAVLKDRFFRQKDSFSRRKG